MGNLHPAKGRRLLIAASRSHKKRVNMRLEPSPRSITLDFGDTMLPGVMLLAETPGN
jgi:hypothetical protein